MAADDIGSNMLVFAFSRLFVHGQNLSERANHSRREGALLSEDLQGGSPYGDRAAMLRALRRIRVASAQRGVLQHMSW